MAFACWWRYGLGLAVILVAGTRAAADDALPIQVLNTLKASTVFLKVDAGKDSSRGSGFVIKTEGQTVHVVTNNHVLDSTPEGRARPGALNPAVTVIFNSGGKDEQSARGEVVAADFRRDLAVVKVANVKNPPPSIDLAKPAQLFETLPVYILGFPMGELLATNKGNPAVTVGKGSVASLRYNERGELARVQIDGDMTPGNSGGPVVDAQGRLVGVTVSTFRGRRIGFAIPAPKLTDGLKGRLLDHHFVTRPAASGALDVRVELGVFDPFNQLKGVSFFYVPRRQPAEKKLAGLPDVQKVNLERSPQQLVGNFTLKPAERGDENVSFQAVYADSDGQTFISNVRERHFRGNAGAPPPPDPVVQAVPKPPPPPATPGKTPVDLVPLIDPARDTVRGNWTINDNLLQCHTMHFAPRIEIPYIPPEEYDLIVVFSQPQFRHGVFAVLPNPKGGSFWWEVAALPEGTRYYLSANNLKVGTAPAFMKVNTAYTLVVQVRRDGVRCLLEDKELVNHKTDFRDMTCDVWRKLRDTRLLAVGCDDPTVFHYVRLVEITGKGSKAR